MPYTFISQMKKMEAPGPWQDLSEKTSAQLVLDADQGSAHESAPAQKSVQPTSRTKMLALLGATWGGIVVTPDVQDMVSAAQTLSLNVPTFHQVLGPDPLLGTVKAFSALYAYVDGPSDCFEVSPHGNSSLKRRYTGDICSQPLYLVSATEQTNDIINITESSSGAVNEDDSQDEVQVLGAEPAWRGGSVDILAVLYGHSRIETPAVLAELADFFEGRRRQIRMTNQFFRVDPWPNTRKTWAVYFRFRDGKRGVQVVAGVEDGALEVPWSRD